SPWPCTGFSTRHATDWFGTSAIRPIRTRSSPVVATAFAPCARVGGSRASPSGSRASTTLSAPRTPPPRLRRRRAWGVARAMAVARDLAGGANNVVCVIGDGAMSAGMAYEAMNNAGARNERLIVVLNDNDMSIAPPVGALSNYLVRISSSGTYLHLRDIAKQL